MKTITSMLAAVATICLAGTAFGKELKNESANFKFDLPDDSNWVEKVRGEVLVAEHKDREMIIELIGHPDQDMNPRAAGFDTGKATALLGQSLGEVKLTNGHVRDATLNGMPCVEYDGDAKNREGKSVFFMSVTCKTADRKGVTAVMFASNDGFKKHKDAAGVVIKSIRRVK